MPVTFVVLRSVRWLHQVDLFAAAFAACVQPHQHDPQVTSIQDCAVLSQQECVHSACRKFCRSYGRAVCIRKEQPYIQQYAQPIRQSPRGQSCHVTTKESLIVKLACLLDPSRRVMQVLQLQSASSANESQAVDYESGIEAMVLAILQQTLYSQQQQLSLAALSLLTSQTNAVADANVLNAYPAFLSDALQASANLSATIQSSLLNASSSSSLIPVSPTCLAEPSEPAWHASAHDCMNASPALQCAAEFL